MGSEPKLDGRYFSGDGSGSVPATLEIRAGKSMLKAEGLEEQDVEIASVSDRLGGLSRKIALEGGALFECADNDAVDRLLGLETGFWSRLTRAESSLPIMAVAAVACIVLLFGIFRYGLPALASAAASVTPPAVIQAIDAGALRTVDRVLFSKSALEEADRARILLLFEELTILAGEERAPLRLEFRDGGRVGANAIALPGGTIIVTDELVGLAENDDEIAGVLAHEIGHVEHRHSLKQIYRVLGLGFMLSVVGGDSGQIVEDVIAQAALLENLSYSRAFEREADGYSVELMVAAGRDPAAFVDLLDRITGEGESDGKTGWLSTHPGSADRREAVEREIERLK